MILLADSGATKTTWTALGGPEEQTFETAGISPYFFDSDQITQLLEKEVLPWLSDLRISKIYYYGTGCSSPQNINIVQQGIAQAFAQVNHIEVQSDMMGTARALCQRSAGIACILGTGSNSCYYDGSQIIRNNPAPGFILGDEGSGAYLGKKVLQYFIYETFDEELMHRFRSKYQTNYRQILDRVYKGEWPNRFLASFAPFLSENRGHYMVENIIEDGLCDFIFTHLYKYPETWTVPLHFTGSIAWHFKDVLAELCLSFELQLGTVLKSPMEGLITYHTPDLAIK
ncbi:MAG TPA: N-acetylglucosamine kinase [Phnomibacter sp.]|nr:N-acetylglucosamine kinase [Phnomibacter sp.]